MGLFGQILFAGQESQLKKYRDQVSRINELESSMEAMSETELEALHVRLREEGCRGHERCQDASSKDFRIRALAFFRTWTKRRLSLRAHDVQLMAAMVLDDGCVAEAATGEGKSLVAHFATYVNNLRGLQCHVVSVNEYLTQRDAHEARLLYDGLSLSVGVILNQQDAPTKRKAYGCDVVYGTPSEFGFDYLRDNMVSHLDAKVQVKGHQFALIDEADSVLIDEARTPLVISGPKGDDSELFRTFAQIVPSFREGVDYIRYREKKTVVPTEKGIDKAEQALGVDNLYDEEGMEKLLPNHLSNALKARFLFQRDKAYIVEDGEIKIVDEFTGRVMAGRSWSDGLHQAIEAKEGVGIRSESTTVATITLQNYFRLYDKRAGMTGTAMTEDAEFRGTYGMEVVAIPPNKPSRRVDEADKLYRTSLAKYNAIVERVEECNAAGQPVLVGSASIEVSERLSALLTKRGITHTVLNAKNHAQEAKIVAQAGRVGAVTIATNMAGRGTDIKLGGSPEALAEQLLERRRARINPATGKPSTLTAVQEEACRAEAAEICAREHEEVLSVGGLMVIGSERHESRRIDNQLRGRCGRQGDPGRSCFYLSLTDELMRVYGDEKTQHASEVLHRSGWDDSAPLTNRAFMQAMDTAQRMVEDANHQARKTLLEYDDVMNKQRLAIYQERDAILAGRSFTGKVDEVIRDTAREAVGRFCHEDQAPHEWDWEGLRAWFFDMTGTQAEGFYALKPRSHMDVDDVEDDVADALEGLFKERCEALGASYVEKLERRTMLAAIDTAWMQHLADMDNLKQGVGLRAYSQRDPLTEYKQDAYDMFGSLVDEIYRDYLRYLFHVSKVSRDTHATSALLPSTRDEGAKPTV